MLCGECGQAAQVFVTFVKGGTAQTIAWCEAHAAAAGVLDPHGYALLDRLADRSAENSPRCPVCDCSQRDFERQGRLGCPACYAAFAGLLPPLLDRMHRGREHRGKIPRRRADSAVVRHRLAQLQAQLNDAVRAERFEWAAQTRDAIAALTAQLLAPPATGRRGAPALPGAVTPSLWAEGPAAPGSNP